MSSLINTYIFYEIVGRIYKLYDDMSLSTTEMSNSCAVSRWHKTAPLNSLSMAIIWVIIDYITGYQRHFSPRSSAMNPRGEATREGSGSALTVLHVFTEREYEQNGFHIIIFPTTKYF